jgi:hypothetical protein
MTYLRPACIVALIILTAASCTELGESRSVSLIDHLDEAKLIPLGAPPPPLPAEPKPFRVVELARDSREAITLPVHSRLALPLEIPRDPEFRFSLATLNPERIELEGVEFTISVVSEGELVERTPGGRYPMGWEIGHPRVGSERGPRISCPG